MRPPDHTTEVYARDLAALTRMYRRALLDSRMSKSERRILEKNLPPLLALFTDLTKKRAAA